MSPIDPRIPLAVESPAPPNPLETLSTIAQIRAVQDTAEIRRQEVELRRQAAEAARQKAREQQRISQAWEDAVSVNPTDGKVKIDRVKLFSALPGYLIPGAQKEFDEDDKRALDLHDKRNALTKSQQELVTSMANTIAASQFHPVVVGTVLKRAHAEKIIDDAQFDELTQADPETFKTIINSLRTRAKPELVEYVTPEGKTVKEYVEPELGQQYEQAPKAASSANIGSFEDYVLRWAAQTGRDPKTITTADIDKLREVYRLDPRITVNAGQRPITQTAEANLITRLNTQWTKATAPKRELDSQLATMRVGLQAAERGDLPQGTEAVLQPFLKILDPNSVVREGEFWRLREGMSLLARAQTVMQRLTKGGFVPVEELKKYAALAEEIATRYNSYVRGERARIGKVADRYSIPQELVFEGDAGEEPPPAAAKPGTTPSTTPGVMSYEEYQRKRKKPGG